MKKTFSFMLAFVMLFSAFSCAAHANGCDHDFRTYGGEPKYENDYLGGHTTRIPMWGYRCVKCGAYDGEPAIIYYDVSNDRHTIATSSQTDSIGKDSSNHWEIYHTYEYCTLCTHKKTLESNLTRNYGAHYTNNPHGAIDGGHSGNYHRYYNYCSKSGCGQYFLQCSIPCPGGATHATPYSVPNQPEHELY